MTKPVRWGHPSSVDVETPMECVDFAQALLHAHYGDGRVLAVRPFACRIMRQGRQRRVVVLVDAEVVKEARPV